ncbi:DUF6519 domain-containing protein [Pendulispora albinea]|uniref:DUF6519 domain-containing protein n=1 Tax=Pendulispora albinea TaxID=2741071 RepID=A0ABZ2MAS5_9BACT
MKGDKSRDTFQARKRYHGVCLQQGRVQVDADWNELVDIVNYLLTISSGDLLGQNAGLAPASGLGAAVPVPANAALTASNSGFGIAVSAGRDDLLIQAGRAYVDGILCESSPMRGQYTFKSQTDLPAPTPATGLPDPTKLLPTVAGNYLVYLDVWQRSISAIEDPSIRELALGGPDTATRSQTVAQVRLLPIDTSATLPTTAPPPLSLPAFQALVNPPNLGALVVSLAAPAPSASPCDVSGSGGFTGVQNQLYRVEIHNGGSLPPTGPSPAPTFKWSRDNGAAVAPIASVTSSGSTGIVVLQSPPVDDVHGFAVGQWIELSDDTTDLQSTLQGNPQGNSQGNPLFFQLTAIRGTSLTFANPGNVPVPPFTDPSRHPKVRRWDIASAPIAATAGAVVSLENGIQVQFQPGTYAAGDHWLIAARTGGGSSSIEFPVGTTITNQSPPSPASLRRGTEHHYAALALVNLALTPQATFNPKVFDYRKRLPGLTALTSDDIVYSAANPQGQCSQLLQSISPPAPLSPPTITNFLEALCQRVSQVATPNAGQVSYTSSGPCTSLLNLSGPTNVAAALDLLCARITAITPASIGALALTGGTLTGSLAVSQGNLQVSQGDILSASANGRVRDQKARVTVSGTDPINTTSTTPVLVKDMTVSVPISAGASAPAGTTVPVAIKFQMQGTGPATAAAASNEIAFRILVNGNVVASGQERFLAPSAAAIEMRAITLERLLFLQTGTYTVTVQWNILTNGITINGCTGNTLRELVAIEL